MESGLFDRFYKFGVIPVLEIDSVRHAKPLAEALLAGGLPVAEVTFRTEAALESIKIIAREVPEIVVGAGTVIDAEQARAAQDAGAQFLVSPGLQEQVVTWARRHQIPIVPGAVTPTEMMRAIQLGVNVLKFFPAESLGGLKVIKAISEPFPQLGFIPTGGIRLEYVAGYLQMEKILAVGGSWLAKRQMIRDGQFDEIKHLARQASNVVKQIRG
jgi:2-dehydro-3-deoxyphosphogluconate aldolase/(4S)-4-hydroxy-2-oxoglutarate aldolase